MSSRKSVARAPEAPVDLIEAGRNLAGSLATRLRNDIVAGNLAPGVKLSIDELRADYGVSLSPVREALSRLATEGFVVLEDKKGFHAAPVSRDNCLEIMKLQCLLEPMALTEAIARGDAAWEESVVAVHHRLSRMERPERKDGAGVDAWEQQHHRFHGALVAACGMPLLLATCDSLNNFSARYRRLFLATHTFDREVPSEHKALMQAALDRDAKEACRMIVRHIERTGKNILAALGGA